MATTPRRDAGVLTAHDGPGILDPARLEMLGRQRPPILSNKAVEIGFIVAILGSTMISEYTLSGFNIALPALATSLNIPESDRTWPAAVPSLTTAALLLPFARLSERFGGRVVFLYGHIWLLVWSLGIGSSAFLPAGLALLGQTYRPGPRKNLVFGLYSVMGCMGFYFGIFVGAVSSQIFGWRWFFWVGTICSFIVTTTGYLTIPKILGTSDSSIKMDWAGLFTIVPGLALVVYALTDGGNAPHGWRTPYIYVTFIVGCLFLVAAIYTQGWYSKQPLLPADLFRPKYMKRLVTSMFMSYGVFGVFLFYASFYTETVIMASPMQTAAWFAPLAAGGLILGLTGGFVLHLIPGRLLLAISGVGFLGSVLLFALIPISGSTSHIYWAYIFPAMACSTIGGDILFNVSNVFITTSLPRRLQAVAGALINSLLYLGIAFWLGVADMATSVAKEIRGSESFSLEEQYRIGFWTAVGIAGLSLCIMITVRIGQAASEMTADEKLQLQSIDLPELGETR